MRERAWVVVIDGTAVIRSGGETIEGRAGTLVTFDPGERHALRGLDDARPVLRAWAVIRKSRSAIS